MKMSTALSFAAMSSVASVLALLPVPAAAQQAPGNPIRLSQFTAPGAQAPSQVSADKLIGRNIRNAQDETIGQINSIMIGSNSRVETVIVGVGGFLGIGEHEVALGWNNLSVSSNGEIVHTTLTKDQLKALPEYKYASSSQRGTVFTTTATAPARTSTTGERISETIGGVADRITNALAPSPVPVTSAAGAIGVSEVVGLNIHNAQNETIGEIKDVVLGSNSSAQSAIVSVGGFLGVGDRQVALSWNQVRFYRENGDLKASVALSKDQLTALPGYKVQLQRVEVPAAR